MGDDHPDDVELVLAPPPLPPPATELPAMLPRPLADPMRVLRTFFLLAMIFTASLAVYERATLHQSADRWEAADRMSVVVLYCWGVFLLFSFWRLLPRGPAAIIYLRSFGNDAGTGRVRVDIQRAVGGGVRVSGIRDPRRRWPLLLRYMNSALFALRYSTPKYLNLEAGDDWKARLWRTLGQARGVVIDVSDPTRHVIAEMQLCLRTMGLERILFIGDASKTVEELREFVSGVLELPADAPIRLAVWGQSGGRRACFRATLREFAAALPTAPRGLHPAGSELALRASDFDESGAYPSDHIWVELAIAIVVSGVLNYMFRFVAGLGTVRMLVILVSLVYALVYFWHFIRYLVECGRMRERALITMTFGLALASAPLILVVLPAVQNVRVAAARMKVSNDLWQIGIAIHKYLDANGHLPSANGPTRPNGPAVSWRVRLLPYIQEQQLYDEYRQDEPWYSDHNRKLIERMPKAYRHVSAVGAPPGHTHFRVFVTPRTVRGPSAVFRDGMPGPSITSITDGSSNTILVVESREPVPWTKPDELEYAANRPLPKIGGHFRNVTYALMADGSVQALPYDLPEATVRALITADGGEVIRE